MILIPKFLAYQVHSRIYKQDTREEFSIYILDGIVHLMTLNAITQVRFKLLIFR